MILNRLKRLRLCALGQPVEQIVRRVGQMRQRNRQDRRAVPGVVPRMGNLAIEKLMRGAPGIGHGGDHSVWQGLIAPELRSGQGAVREGPCPGGAEHLGQAEKIGVKVKDV